MNTSEISCGADEHYWGRWGFTFEPGDGSYCWSRVCIRCSTGETVLEDPTVTDDPTKQEEDDMNVEIGDGGGMPQEETEEVTPLRVMEFVGVSVGELNKGMFNTMRVGRRWADLEVGDTVRLACTVEAGGPETGSIMAMVAHVATNTVYDLIRSHSAMNFSVRDEANPETRELALCMELRGHYGLGLHVATMGGTVVYFMPYDGKQDRWLTSAS